MDLIWKRFTSPLITPKDFKCYARIVHRSVCTHSWGQAHSLNCRLCDNDTETFSHLASCKEIKKVFDPLLALIHRLTGNPINLTPPEYSEFIFLGTLPNEPCLPSALSALHIIMWKFTLIAFTLKDLEGTKFNPESIWTQSVIRFRVRIQAHEEKTKRLYLRLMALDKGILPLPPRDKVIAPIGHYTIDEGNLKIQLAPATETLFNDIITPLTNR